MRHGFGRALAMSAAVTTMLLPGCWLTDSLDGLTTDRTDATDATDRTDATNDSGKGPGHDSGSVDDSGTDAGDAGPSGPQNLLVNPGFEEGIAGQPGCGTGWQNLNSTISTVTSPHTGKNACLVCPSTETQTVPFELIAATNVTVDASGATYAADAYFRLADADGGQLAYQQVQVEERRSTSDPSPVYTGNARVLVSTAWSDESLEVPMHDESQLDAGTVLSYVLLFSFDTPPHYQCVLVDDASWYQQ